MAAGRTGDSLCGSEHYTDSGIHHADSNQLEDDHRLIHDEREHRHLLGIFSYNKYFNIENRLDRRKILESKGK